MIGQLVLVQLTTRKTGRKDVSKLKSRPFINKISWSANYFIYILSSSLPICHLNKLKLTNGISDTGLKNLRANLV